MSIRVVFSGAAGRMGRTLVPALAAADGIDLVGEVEKNDDLTVVARSMRASVVVDFTAPAAAMGNARAILRARAQGVIGTTGFSETDLQELDREARATGNGLLVAPNFALGMILLQRFAAEAARHFPAVEVIEAHHPGKVDAPSGTAMDTARRLAAGGAGAAAPFVAASRGQDVGGIPVHSMRLPGVLAHQEVHFGGPGERLVLTHDVASRACFVPGVLAAVRAIPGRVGLIRGLEPILFAHGGASPAGPR